MTVVSFNSEQLRVLERHALSVVRELGTQGLSYFNTILDSSQKADGSVVSAADRAIEQKARTSLARITPEFGFVGEEFGSAARLSNLQQELDSQSTHEQMPFSGLNDFELSLSQRPSESLNLDTDTYWILDPIDGTINFLSQVPQWSTLLALVHKGRPLLGVVAMPALNEVFIASVGNGARYAPLFSEHAGTEGSEWSRCRVRQASALSECQVSFSTAKTFAYRGIESFVSVLLEESKECRTHSDAFGYTRVLMGAVDIMLDPLVAPYDVAALQVLFDETPGAVFTTLQGHQGDRRFRMGSAVGASSRQLADALLERYRSHLIATAQDYCSPSELLTEPVSPEGFAPTFLLRFESNQSTSVPKIWARSVETAIAIFMKKNTAARVEDVAVLLGTKEAASRIFSNGKNEGPPEFIATTTFHVRAIVNGSAGLATGTPGLNTHPVQIVSNALDSAFIQAQANTRENSEDTLAAREPVIAHVGQHPWQSVQFSQEFQNISSLIQKFQNEKYDDRIHSLKSVCQMRVEYRWQYFMDSSQQTFVTQVCRVSSQATCAESAEKRTAYSRYLKNKTPDAETLQSDLKDHFRRVTQQSVSLIPAALVPENPEYDFLAVDADLLGLILHEAIGHAAEGDLIQTRTSGFGESGVMKELRVAPDWLDIMIDGSLDNCGYLPVDAEGVRPRRKLLVKNGKLIDAIHTRQTARTANKTPDGCARVESLQHPSLNRMTSIWVRSSIEKPLPVNQEQDFRWDDVSPAVVQKVLEDNGYLDGPHGVLLLSGWKGGTASCSNLEFRADVARVLHLKKGRNPTLMREANFTGIATECFRSAVDAFGPALCRSIGTCGKDGQGVLTSDGGPAFMVFRPNPKVRVIGSGDSEVEST